MYEALADLIVVIHLGYVSFVVIGQLLIIVGYFLKWQWIRNWYFRLLHLLAISIVAFEAIAGIACPLTVWESQLRELAGKPSADETFIGRLVHQVLFFDLPPWVFTVAYVSFALAVLATMILVPPRRKADSAADPTDGSIDRP